MVDLAAEAGGNCEYTAQDAVVATPGGVSVVGYTDLPSRMATQVGLAQPGWTRAGCHRPHLWARRTGTRGAASARKPPALLHAASRSVGHALRARTCAGRAPHSPALLALCPPAVLHASHPACLACPLLQSSTLYANNVSSFLQSVGPFSTKRSNELFVDVEDPVVR